MKQYIDKFFYEHQGLEVKELGGMTNLTHQQFNDLFKQLQEDHSKLWKNCFEEDYYDPNFESICDLISLRIKYWFLNKEIKVLYIHGKYGLNYHCFNLLLVNNTIIVVDGSFKQFDFKSERLRTFNIFNKEYSHYTIDYISIAQMKEKDL